MVKLLLRCPGTDVDRKFENRTALDMAEMAGHEEISKLLASEQSRQKLISKSGTSCRRDNGADIEG